MLHSVPDLQLFQCYRGAEYHGAALLQRLSRKTNDPRLQIELTRQMADEAHHALLWTKRICELGGHLVPARNTSRQHRQQRPGSTATELALFAQLYVAEEKLGQQYQAHLARASQDPQTKSILETILAEEEWHQGWVKQILTEQSRKFGNTRVAAIIDYFWNA
jgi:bacterioferritin (cytochrome b1)